MTEAVPASGLSGIRLHKPIWVVAAALLALPLVAMAFTREMAWGPGDFLIAAVLLFSACGAYELAVRAIPRRQDRVLAAAVILGALLLVWAELAVGIFG